MSDGFVPTSSLCECPGCGRFQTLPPVPPGTRARCNRCGMTLRRGRLHPLSTSLALHLAGLILLVILCGSTLMNVGAVGMDLSANLFSGPEELTRRGMGELGLVVIFVTVIAPFGKLLGVVYVLLQAKKPRPPRHLRRVFAWALMLRPWSMLEIFVLGVFVAYTKLNGLVSIHVDIGLYALLCATLVLVWADASFDPEAVWQRIAGPSVAPENPMEGPGPPIACEVCGMVSRGHSHCPRCESVLHERKPNSLSRTWALVIAATVLYIPANVYPVLTVVQLGAGSPSTILGGVEELLSARMYPLALLVFGASIAVPVLKLIGLVGMLLTTQARRTGWLRDRTRLYHAVRVVGRWSMVDIFMESLLGALVRFGAIVTIAPGIGAIAFCGVVILTMFAAETFDPRLMWDAAEPRSA